MPPQEFVDGITAQFRALWEKLEVRYSDWAATTEKRHKTCVRNILERLWDDTDPATGASRWIYKDKRGGYYSVRQEQFLTDKERGPDGQFGPEWGQVEFREEENYYFRLEGRKQWLLDLIDARSRAGTPLVVPDFRVAELRNAVERLAGDLCISRPKARLAWGIELPFDADFVTFVWFDALVNYISFAPGYDPAVDADLTAFRRWWPAVHIIGKDILVPAHGVYWPIMLSALGFADDEIPTLLVHGWWGLGGAKMSKSEGNSVDPGALADKYGTEALRFYLMSDIATGRDADFSEERLVQRYNSELANNLGNLLNRTLSMTQKYRQGILRASDLGAETSDAFERPMDEYNTQGGLAWIDQTATLCNTFIDSNAPWKLAKDPARATGLDHVLYYLCDHLRMIAIALFPFLPDAAHGIFDQLKWKVEQAGQDGRFHLEDLRPGLLPDGHQVGAPKPLFPRIETKPVS